MSNQLVCENVRRDQLGGANQIRSYSREVNISNASLQIIEEENPPEDRANDISFGMPLREEQKQKASQDG